MSWDLIKEWQSNLPSNGQISRRTWLTIKFTAAENGKTVDISEDISKFFISMDYTDNMDGKADDLSINLEDRAGLWLNSWLPDDEGNLLDVTAHTFNRITLSDGEVVTHLGKFEIDEVTCKGSPATAQIKAVSVVGNSSLRSQKKNDSWEKVTLKKIAEDIASRNNLSLLFDCDENPENDHIEQANQTDLEFLTKLCSGQGLSLKVTPEQLIIFDEYKYELQEPLITVYKPGTEARGGKDIFLTWVSDWDFRNKTRDTYDKCIVKTQKSKKKDVISGEFAAPNTSADTKKILYINQQVKDEVEAKRLAKKKLREANKEKFTGSFITIINFNFAAGITLDIRGFGKFDGKYIVTKVNHSISTSDSKTTVDVRKCLDGY